MQTLKIENDSTKTLPPGFLEHAHDALQQGLNHVAHAWSERIWHITAALHAHGFRMMLVDDLPEAPGALAYHDVDENGPFIRVGLNTVFDAGGDWYTGNLSVMSVMDHESKELVGDPACCLWANDVDGVLWARELCDAVESDVYEVTCADGTVATLSDFLLPQYFNPLAQSGAPMDWMGLVKQPFEIRPGGYAIRLAPGKITQVFNKTEESVRPDGLHHRALERTAYFPNSKIDSETQ